MDQIAAGGARASTRSSRRSSCAIEGRDFAGACDAGYSCAYTNTISWRSATTPLPMENNPRAVFERLFGDGDSTDPAARLRRIADRSQHPRLGHRQGSRDLNRRVGPRDRGKLTEYLEAVRDVERRIQKAEEQSSTRAAGRSISRRAFPTAFEEHAKLMFDLQVLAYQTDLTRVITFMMGRELSGRDVSRRSACPRRIIRSRITTTIRPSWRSSRRSTSITRRCSAYYVEKLRNTPDGDGSLLDHMMIIYGAGMADSNAHAPSNLPMMLVGGGAGTLNGGRHIRYPMDTPLANLHLTLLDRLGITESKRSATAAAASNSSPCSWIPGGARHAYPPVNP